MREIRKAVGQALCLLALSLSISVMNGGLAAADVCAEIHVKADRFSRDRAIFADELRHSESQRILPSQNAALCMAGANVLADLAELGKVTASKCFESYAAYQDAMNTIPDAVAGTKAIGDLHGCHFQK